MKHEVYNQEINIHESTKLLQCICFLLILTILFYYLSKCGVLSLKTHSRYLMKSPAAAPPHK